MDDSFDVTDPVWRASLGSVRYERMGEDYRAIPDFTIPMAVSLNYRELPAQEPRPEMFSGLFTPGTQGWEDFFSTRKVVYRYDSEGRRFASVTSNVADALERPASAPGLKRPKEYEVVHLLTDVDLKNKFRIRGDFLARMRNMAVVDTAKAARALQQHVRTFEGSERAAVVVGKYAGSWKAARDCIRQFSSRFPITTVHIDASLIGDRAFLYGPDASERWRVFGPVSCASLVQCVHRMVAASSCESVIFAFGLELTLLDIDVHNGDGVLCPVRECHAGFHTELPLRSSAGVGAILSPSSMSRLRELCSACETFSAGGEDIATAVRITGRYVLVNAHVLNEEGPYAVDGVPLVPYRMVSSDLWIARARGREAAWTLRTAEPGEMVIVCYKRHDELQFLGPVEVKTVSEHTLSLGLAPGMLPGVSGGAIVAVRDFALLGTHDGVSMRSALGATFSPEMYTDICSMSEMGDSSHASARDEEGSVYVQMKERGLGGVVDTAMAAVVPLYSADVHIGMGYPAGGKLYTTCDPGVAPLTPLGGAVPLVFDREGPYFVAPYPDGTGPAVTRKPSYGEKVFVVGRDADGEYVSSSQAKVVHIGVGSGWFQITGLDIAAALPLQGGMILAVSDAAVVGVFKSSAYDARFGEVGQCVATPKASTVVAVRERPEAVIQRVFPFLRPEAWPVGVAESVLTHASAGESAVASYAMVGDSAMRSVLWVRLLEAGVPTARWQDIFQEVQSNARWAEVCEQLGLAKEIRTSPSVKLKKGSKFHADVLEAVGGAVYLHEAASTLEKFCVVVGGVRETGQYTGG